MKSKDPAVKAYLDTLPPDRKEALNAVRKVMLKNLDPQYEEGIQYGMIGYYVPHTIHPPGYHCNPKLPLPFAVLGSKKDHMSLHLMCVYHTGNTDSLAHKLSDWFTKAWAKTGKKLDMGKACLRFKSADDLALQVLGDLIKKVPVATWIKMQPEPKKTSAKKVVPAKSSKRAAKNIKSTTK